MAKVTNAFQTYQAIGNREDLTDLISILTPTDTPVFSMAGKGVKATGVFHEWQTDVLPTANTVGRIEGDSISRAAVSPTTRVGNYCMIQRRDATVSGTQRKVLSAGRRDEMAFQVMKMGKALKNSMEKTITANQGYSAGTTGGARYLRGLNAWLTNTSRGTGGADRTTLATAAATDATTGNLRALATTTGSAAGEGFAKAVLRACVTDGGRPKTIVVGPFNKQSISTWIGRTQARQNVGPNMINASADVYASDYGNLRVVYDIYSRDRDAWFLDPEYIKIAYLRPIHSYMLGTIGDADTEVVQVEYTLQVSNPDAHGLVADLTTS